MSESENRQLKKKSRHAERAAAHNAEPHEKRHAKNADKGTHTVSSNRLEMLVTVIARNKAEYYMDLIQSFNVNMQVMALAQGTADAKTMRYLGLTDSDKSVIFSIIQENKIPDALAALEEKFASLKGGKGIAFTVPLASVIGKLLFGFLSDNRTFVKEGI